MMPVHAAPKTQPGGVHGALFNVAYHSEETPLPVKSPPNARAEKFITRNNMNFIAIIYLCLNNEYKQYLSLNS